MSVEKNNSFSTRAIALNYYSFFTYGHGRNSSNLSQWKTRKNHTINQGFTGHVREAPFLQGKATEKNETNTIPPAKRGGKHMDLFGLINMSNEVRSHLSFPAGNGRIYDPGLGRFLSPDPYVQIPQNAQNFNRYSYALNNPLVYTDPSGYKIQGGIDYNPGAIWYINSASRSINNAGSYYSSSFYTCGINLSAFYGNYSSVSGGVYLNYRGDVVSFNQVMANYVQPNAFASYSGWTAQAVFPAGKAIGSVVNYARQKSGSVSRSEIVNVTYSDFSDVYVATQNGDYYVDIGSPMVSSPNVGVGGSEGDGSVYFMQAEGRIAWPIGELGVTTSLQIGLIFDSDFNAAVYFTPSLGGSSGGGYFYGGTWGVFPGANSVSDVKGWGANAGFIYAIGVKGFGLEGNAAISKNDVNFGGTFPSPFSGGYGGAGYAEFSYSFMSQPVNLLNSSSEQFSNYLNNTIPGASYSPNDALQIIHFMYKMMK